MNVSDRERGRSFRQLFHRRLEARHSPRPSGQQHGVPEPGSCDTSGEPWEFSRASVYCFLVMSLVASCGCRQQPTADPKAGLGGSEVASRIREPNSTSATQTAPAWFEDITEKSGLDFVH